MLILPWFADSYIHKMDEILFKNDNSNKILYSAF